MKTKKGLRGFFGVIALAALLMFAVSACDDEGDSGNGPKLPSVLQNTEWVHQDGDRVKFGTNTVTVIPASGAEKTFTLKDSVTVSELSQTTLYFGDNQISDFIVYRDGTIASVGLGGVQKTGGWRLYTNNGGGDPSILVPSYMFNTYWGTVRNSSYMHWAICFTTSNAVVLKQDPSRPSDRIIFEAVEKEVSGGVVTLYLKNTNYPDSAYVRGDWYLKISESGMKLTGFQRGPGALNFNSNWHEISKDDWETGNWN